MRALALALVTVLALPATALAVADGDLKNLGSGTPSQTHVSGTGVGSIGRVMLGLLVVVVVIVVLYVIARRAQRGKPVSTRSSGSIELLDTLAVTPQRSLHLVRVADRVLLIGATDHGIATLQVLSPTEAEDAGLTDTAATADDIALTLADPPAGAERRGLLDSIRERTVR